MAKRTCNLNLDEKTIDALDTAAEILNMSRSQVADKVLAATLGDASATDLVETMFSAALQKGNAGGSHTTKELQTV